MTTYVSVGFTAVLSGLAAIISIVATYFLTKRREHEAEWRKLKFEKYQEFLLALSEIVRGRSNADAQNRYADAVNILSLVASPEILKALQAFQSEISYMNRRRTDTKHDEFLQILLLKLRNDIEPNSRRSARKIDFHLLSPPPEGVQNEE